MTAGCPAANGLAASRSTLGLAAVAALMLAACGPAQPPASPTAPPPAEVGVVVAKAAPLGLVTEMPGRTEASRVAQVRARVSGILLKRKFREGSDVTSGQTLFRIDGAPFKATLASARAAQARAEANLVQARAQAERYKPLVEANAISQQDYVNAVAARKQAEADVAAAKASVESAQINVGYSTVKAPISGRIGRALVSEGALVGQGEATPLAVVQQIDPMYVNFTQPAAEALRLRAAIASGKLQGSGGGQALPVTVLLEDGSSHPQPGRLLFSDLTVDATSGQITLRAEVPNPNGTLLPGLYVRVRLEQAQSQSAILLPQQAVARGNEGDSVKVVLADGKVATRPVKLGAAQAGQWVILDGLAGGEQVMVDGFQKVRGSAPVKPVPWQPAVASAPVAAASAASR